MAVAPQASTLRRFALVCPNYYPRTCGVGDHSMRVAQELARRGFDTAIFTRAPAEPNPEAPAIPVFAGSGATPLVVAEDLRRQIAAYGPTDLIIQYTPQMLGASRWGSPATLWLALAARRAGINVVLLAHELFLPWSRRPDLAVGAALMRIQLAALMKIADHVVVTMAGRTEEVAGLVRLTGRRRPVGVVRVGSSAVPIPRRPAVGRFRLGLFSTLAFTKRFDVILDCFQIVQSRRPEAELVILGDLGHSTDRRVRAFHEAVSRHPARDRIHLPGRQELGAIAEEVSRLDVYLFPMISGANTRSSTLPLALGAGVPTVAIDSYETDDLFVDRQNILFAEKLTGESFAEAALQIANDPTLAARLSAGALTLFRDHLAWERIGDELLARIQQPHAS